MEMMKNKKAQIGGRVMAVIFGTILIVAVAIPITLDVINQTIPGTNTTVNGSDLPVITGTTATVIGFIPLFLGLAGLALAAALVGGAI